MQLIANVFEGMCAFTQHSLVVKQALIWAVYVCMEQSNYRCVVELYRKVVMLWRILCCTAKTPYSKHAAHLTGNYAGLPCTVWCSAGAMHACMLLRGRPAVRQDWVV